MTWTDGYASYNFFYAIPLIIQEEKDLSVILDGKIIIVPSDQNDWDGKPRFSGNYLDNYLLRLSP